MINPNELRIGNLIFDDDGALCKIIGFQPYGHSVRCDESEGCDILIDIYAADGKIRKGFSVESTLVNPIPLTPEWLQKCGFEFKDMMFENIPMRYWRKDWFILHGTEMYIWNDKEVPLIIKIDYLHQFQNLVFNFFQTDITLKDI